VGTINENHTIESTEMGSNAENLCFFFLIIGIHAQWAIPELAM
jgi:hypothetical protein